MRHKDYHPFLCRALSFLSQRLLLFPYPYQDTFPAGAWYAAVASCSLRRSRLNWKTGRRTERIIKVKRITQLCAPTSDRKRSSQLTDQLLPEAIWTAVTWLVPQAVRKSTRQLCKTLNLLFCFTNESFLISLAILNMHKFVLNLVASDNDEVCSGLLFWCCIKTWRIFFLIRLRTTALLAYWQKFYLRKCFALF